MALGIDIGSASLKCVIVENNKIIYARSFPVEGDPKSALLSALEFEHSNVGITGSTGKKMAEMLNLPFVDEVTTALQTAGRYYPDARTILEIGRENSKFLQLGKNALSEYNMNTRCAAGTGSFLDSKAKRAGKTLEEFEKSARKSKRPAPIAGRCVVFAETDMVHHFQEGIPEHDIIAGLYLALSKNFVSATIPKSAKLLPKVLFIGGVSQSSIMRDFILEEIRRRQSINAEDFVVPQHNIFFHAIGAALSAKPAKINRGMLNKLKTNQVECWPKLKIKKSRVLTSTQYKGTGKAYLGLDVGSVSTKAAIIDENEKVIASHYLYTRLNPAEAVKRLMKELYKEVGDSVEIIRAATCGSGRFMNAVLIGADEIIDEISAQGLGCMTIYPEVDTIFEIGGQDSKYLRIENSMLESFEMNKECAAGTGSFLEEQAGALGILKDDGKPDLDLFGELALEAARPANTGERCTVFMESEVIQHQQNRVDVRDICAGLCMSVAQNYLNRVVEGKPIGNHIMFTGAVAKYKGLIAAFEQLTGKPITVPHECKLTGAIGAALAAKRSDAPGSFAGFQEIISSEVELQTVLCEDCANVCRISGAKIQRPGGEIAVYYTGDRCGKFQLAKKKTLHTDYFAEREKLLFTPTEQSKKSMKIGMLRTLMHNDYYPYWHTFLSSLGFQVVLSDQTNKRIIEDGVDMVAGEPCFPQKVVYGHLQNLVRKGIKKVFIPCVVETGEPPENIPRSLTCPYVQGTPYILQSSFPEMKFIIPYVNFRKKAELVRIGDLLGKPEDKVLYALKRAQQAQDAFRKSVTERGREVLKELAGKEAYVLIARPYHYDSGICLDLWKRMQQDLEVPVLPMDYLPLEEYPVGAENMYWKYGQNIMRAANVINDSYNRKDMPRLRPVFMTNFGCGPNSFVYPYFKKKCKVPAILISIDEHSAAAGIITRYQAGHRMRRQHMFSRKLVSPKDISKPVISSSAHSTHKNSK